MSPYIILSYIVSLTKKYELNMYFNINELGSNINIFIKLVITFIKYCFIIITFFNIIIIKYSRRLKTL